MAVVSPPDLKEPRMQQLNSSMDEVSRPLSMLDQHQDVISQVNQQEVDEEEKITTVDAH